MGSYIFDGVDDKLSVNTAVVTAVPLTIGIWFEADNVTASHTLATLGDTAGFTDYFGLAASGLTAGDPIQAATRSASASSAASSASGYSANTWHSACAVFVAANDRSAFINGSNKGTETTSITPAGLDRLSIGCLGRATDSSFLAGHIGYVCIWNVALSNAEVLSWHGGTVPQFGNLVAAYDLTFDHAGPINDEISTNNLTVAGSIYDAATSPPVSYSFGGGVESGLTIQSVVQSGIEESFGGGGGGELLGATLNTASLGGSTLGAALNTRPSPSAALGSILNTTDYSTLS